MILDEKHYVLIVFNETEPGEKFLHDALIKVINHSELLILCRVFEHILLDLLQGIFVIVENTDWHLISIVVEVYKTIVQEEATVALLSVAVVDLFTALDVVESFNDEASPVISVVPGCLSRSLVVEHICIGHESISLNSINLDAKDTT